jgi:hypothetical protein
MWNYFVLLCTALCLQGTQCKGQVPVLLQASSGLQCAHDPFSSSLLLLFRASCSLNDDVTDDGLCVLLESLTANTTLRSLDLSWLPLADRKVYTRWVGRWAGVLHQWLCCCQSFPQVQGSLPNQGSRQKLIEDMITLLQPQP